MFMVEYYYTYITKYGARNLTPTPKLGMDNWLVYFASKDHIIDFAVGINIGLSGRAPP